MSVVLDTNVIISGVFFGGVPGRILKAWAEGQVGLVLSPPILSEYRRVGGLLSARHAGVDFEPFASLLVVNSTIVDAPAHLAESVSSDPDDDKFLACAISANVAMIVSGDPHLIGVSGWRGITVLTPRQFVDGHLAPDR